MKNYHSSFWRWYQSHGTEILDILSVRPAIAHFFKIKKKWVKKILLFFQSFWSTFKCTQCNKTCHTKSRCFEIVGYSNWWDHNRDQRKKDSKKTSTTVVAEIKTEANVDEKASALVAATDYGRKFLNTSTSVINSAWIIDSGATDHMTFDSRQV